MRGQLLVGLKTETVPGNGWGRLSRTTQSRAATAPAEDTFTVRIRFPPPDPPASTGLNTIVHPGLTPADQSLRSSPWPQCRDRVSPVSPPPTGCRGYALTVASPFETQRLTGRVAQAVSQREDARYRRRERISRDRRGTLHRRLLVEAACHHRRPYRRPRPCATGGAWPRRRREPREPREPREDAGNQGLHERWLRFNEGK
jgi:hypothetical protein